MGRLFQNILAPAVVALLLLSSMGGVLGWRTEMVIKEMPEEKESSSSSAMQVVVPEMMAELKQIIMKSANEDLKKALLQAETLQCVSQGSYCNIVFGPQCCSVEACIPPGLIGGVCVG